MPTDLEVAFNAIARAMEQAAQERSIAAASGEAERNGLVEREDETQALLSPTTIWERTDEGTTLRFKWQWYDQSKPYSIRPDMNVMSLELWAEGKIIRQTEA